MSKNRKNPHLEEGLPATLDLWVDNFAEQLFSDEQEFRLFLFAKKKIDTDPSCINWSKIPSWNFYLLRITIPDITTIIRRASKFYDCTYEKCLFQLCNKIDQLTGYTNQVDQPSV